MCTVTFIPLTGKVVITSNRDEQDGRAAATKPSLYALQTGKLLFPKDAHAGGTWFAVHENGNAIIFLNGSLQKHIPNPPYRKSRGLVLLDLADQELPLDGFNRIDLKNIEPFTALIWQDEQLFECRWNGLAKEQEERDAGRPHIWSSVTLYDEAAIARREYWFREWLKKNQQPRQEDILQFHQFTGDGDRHNDLLMNRNNRMFTVSITSAVFTPDAILMKYMDTRSQESFLHELPLKKAIPAK